MRVISSRAHGVIDYVTGALLILAPWLFGFANGGPEQWVPIILGAAAILYSLVTDYELGVAKLIPLPVHLILDMGSGVILLLSPWIFGFADVIAWPHVLVGAMEIIIPMFTVRHPADAPAGAQPDRL